ncbi:MAG: FAD:protein FMN transferase [Rubrivivax sp.]
MPNIADVVLSPTPAGWRGSFRAMASPCELLMEGVQQADSLRLARLAQGEALRIERKFSRYRDDSVVARLHASRGAAVTVDDETADLIDFAAHCHAASGGLFDITSGVLRQAWRFDGGSSLPDAARVESLRRRVGWARVRWQRPKLTLPEGMELDLGGIGKEYAVDRTLALLRAETAAPLLVNFGGDLAVSGPRRDGSAWAVGIDNPSATERGTADNAAGVLALSAGGARAPAATRAASCSPLACATAHPRPAHGLAGARRATLGDRGRAHLPTEAGVLATLAMLRGPDARAWLAEQGAPHWIVDD